MGAHRKDYSVAVDLYNKGMSIGDVADYFGTTRQAMWKILQRRDVIFRPRIKSNKENHFYRHGNGYSEERRRASVLVAKAIKRGKLIPRPCEVCGFEGRCRDGRNKIHAHHDDYSKPLEVRWLCKACHHKEHEK